LLNLGVPSYGFSPLRQPRGETYLDRYHGVDERVSLAGLRWGLPVLYDAVRRFCG
jgi:acetylornithine deacetylase/succinyl-diaminopimelate desuccinylase-like protein